MQKAKTATSRLAQSDVLPAPSEATFGEAKRRTAKKKKRVTTVFAEPVDFVKTSRSDQDFVADPEIHG